MRHPSTETSAANAAFEDVEPPLELLVADRERDEDPDHVPVDAAVVLSPEQLDEIVAVDVALERLAKADERKSKVLEMRFFGGLSVDEIAEVVKISPQSVKRDWKLARAWLLKELRGPTAV